MVLVCWKKNPPTSANIHTYGIFISAKLFLSYVLKFFTKNDFFKKFWCVHIYISGRNISFDHIICTFLAAHRHMYIYIHVLTDSNKAVTYSSAGYTVPIHSI